MIQNDQTANATNFNNAFVSKTASQTVSGDKVFSDSISTPDLKLTGSTSGTVTQEAADTTTDYTFKWPAAQSSGSLINDGSGNLSWGVPSISSAFYKPSVARYTSGSSTHLLPYKFKISSGSATSGATYTNNSQTFTVRDTISSDTELVCTATGAPASSGTLTKTSGTGDATITFTSASQPLFYIIEMAGGGGGGGGTGSSASGGAGGNGGNTTFGSSLLTAAGGTGGSAPSSLLGGVGGNPTVNSPAIDLGSFKGGGGAGAFVNNSASVFPNGGIGGVNAFGGNSSAGNGNGTSSFVGQAPAANSGAGGAGASSASGTQYGGCGGGAGAYVRALIQNPSSSYSVTVGSGGTAGTAGTTGSAGSAGAAGIVIVQEFYQ